MYCLIDFCCICFYNKEHLQPLSNSDIDNITYLIKLTSCVPEMCFNEMNDQCLVCNKCCETMDAAYKFRQRCLKSKTLLKNYISQYKNRNTSGAVDNFVTDINKFGDYQLKNNIMQIETIKNLNVDRSDIKNSEDNLGTRIKRENSPINSKLIDTGHNRIEFENVLIKPEQEHQYFEEQIKENYNNVVNQDNIKTDNLLDSVIKRENEYNGQLQENYENIFVTCDNANDKLEINLEKYLEINIDILDNDTKSVNDEINIQYEHISLEDRDKTDKDQNCTITTTKNKPKIKSNLQDVDNQEANKVKTVETPHECGVCHRKIKTLAHFKAHIKIHTGEKSFECNFCQKKFIESSSLKKHIRIHTGEKPHVCEICEKKFTHLATLKNHMKVHTNEKPHSCNVCQQKFAQISTLTTHMLIHTMEKPYVCDVCRKQFKKLSYLKTHMKIHSGEKDFECFVCNKRFIESSSLSKHIRIHTGERRHECTVCQKKFTHLATLRKHMRTHPGEKTYVCSLCEEKFTHLSILKTHMSIHEIEEPMNI